jgi:hypothetical protein
MDMIFTDKTDWQLYFRLLLRIDAWDWSRWLFSWILEVYEKDGVKENRMNELGLLWDSAMNRFLKDMENVIRTIEFYIWRVKTHPSPSQEGVRSIRKKSWFNFQNYWYEDDSKFQLSKHNSQKRTQRNSLLKGETDK